MPRESFLNLRKYERMIEKITLPTPIHLLDHIIIPIHIRKSHWFPAHINLRTRSISLLDSSQVYSAAAYPHQRMLIWKFFRMVWTTHAEAAAPVPYWTIPPERFIGLHHSLLVAKGTICGSLFCTQDCQKDWSTNHDVFSALNIPRSSLLELPWIVHSRRTIKISPSIILSELRMLRQILLEFPVPQS